MASNFKWNPQGFRQLEREIQRNLQKRAPEIQLRTVDPLVRDLNRLSGTHKGRDKSTIRAVVEQAFRNRGLQPNEIGPIIDAIHNGEDIPPIPLRVAPVRIDPPS